MVQRILGPRILLLANIQACHPWPTSIRKATHLLGIGFDLVHKLLSVLHLTKLAQFLKHNRLLAGKRNICGYRTLFLLDRDKGLKSNPSLPRSSSPTAAALHPLPTPPYLPPPPPPTAHAPAPPPRLLPNRHLASSAASSHQAIVVNRVYRNPTGLK
ncbi:hypothetical protein BRADI_1g67286v3 [Brachypodium distachyon]|uniref:Uncharacterized protein n=1 Tax=Brachypodium distachyon TaxID=15368 RepID=A0A0Q3HHN4_BRADI|nr:hypothetical protein BRADI_1g67286v3 [Brachypodium distachyon]